MCVHHCCSSYLTLAMFRRVISSPPLENLRLEPRRRPQSHLNTSYVVPQSSTRFCSDSCGAVAACSSRATHTIARICSSRATNMPTTQPKHVMIQGLPTCERKISIFDAPEVACCWIGVHPEDPRFLCTTFAGGSVGIPTVDWAV